MDGELQYVTRYNELSLITYFTHELRIPYFVSYESPPDRGSMVENWYLRVNEPLGLLKRSFQTNNYLVFWNPAASRKIPKDFHWCLFSHYDPNLRDFYNYRKEIPADTPFYYYYWTLSNHMCWILLAYLIPERGCFNLVNAGGGLASLTKKAPQQEFQNPLTFVSLGSTPCEPNAFWFAHWFQLYQKLNHNTAYLSGRHPTYLTLSDTYRLRRKTELNRTELNRTNRT